MKKLLTLAIIIILLAMQSCTDELPDPEKRKQGKDNYDRIDGEKVRNIGGNKL